MVRELPAIGTELPAVGTELPAIGTKLPKRCMETNKFVGGFRTYIKHNQRSPIFIAINLANISV